MENLIKKLQDEAGLTEEQALKVLSTLKDYMDKENLKIDWNKFFKGKYEDFSEKFKSLSDKVNESARPYTERISEKVDDVVSKAKKSAHDLSQKAADFFDDSKK